MYGLMQTDIEYIKQALSQFTDIKKAIIFGSRAHGNYKKGSDVDLAICGEEISDNTVYNLNDLLNEVYPLPYFFDLLHYEHINNEYLLEHINTEGKVIYIR
ncbi:nucleotidyltransferase domain-containing protein [Pseudalkalibacillus decolorationis]|uniref:nucleotidyltransferase domain-containing protein n=1 Tax=Pseudalkalibacillus decolorationis TaxID=163879 RepID=UPI0021488E41|nr:nucleotidyltransferase domain-containing protein [Pseudalkalibacillus decolorationis]